MTRDVEVFIIGAGPAGLTAAYCLTKETSSVIVIEKDPVYVGGITRTVRYKDIMFDIGGHRFFSKAKEVVDCGSEILPDDFIERPRLSRIFYRGKYYSYPLRAIEALTNLGLFTAPPACCPTPTPAAPIADRAHSREWVRNQFGKRLFSIFFKTYTEKVWGMSCDEISADWAAQRIKGLDLGVAVRNALKRASGRKPQAPGGEPVVKTLIESFQYPRKGPGMMWEPRPHKIRARRQRAHGPRAADSWPTTRPASSGDRGLRPPTEPARPTPPVTSSARRRFASCGPDRRRGRSRSPCACAALPRFPHRRADGEASPSCSRTTGSTSTIRPSRSAACRTSALVAGDGAGGHDLPRPRVFLLRGRRAVDPADADLIALAKQRDRADRPVDARDIVDGCVVRQPKAYPVYDDDYRDNVAMVRLDLETQLSHPASRRPQRHAQIQQPGSRDDDRDADGEKHPGGRRATTSGGSTRTREYHETGTSGIKEALKSERLVPQRVKAAANG